MPETPTAIPVVKRPAAVDDATVDRDVPLLGSMSFRLPVSMERMFENALDWEHLPWVHASSFTSIDIIEAGSWGWHAWATVPGSDDKIRLELRLDREMRRWITRTLEGNGKGAEIWTNIAPEGDEQIHLVIDFFAPVATQPEAAAYFEGYSTLYQQLYDEDLALMLDRQAGLDERGGRNEAPAETLDLGSQQEVAASLPLVVEAFGSTWRVVETGGELTAHAGRCPHKLGSLLDADVDDGHLTCPWHGYRFDIHTGESVDGHRCRLLEAPSVDVVGSRVVLRSASHTASTV